MIKTIVFDLGGVIFAQSFEGAIRHFEEIGVKDARKILDPFTQLVMQTGPMMFSAFAASSIWKMVTQGLHSKRQ